MQVFHYYAERLKNRDIFVTCTDMKLKQNEAKKVGAKYNDFDNDPLTILNEAEVDENQSENDGGDDTSQTETVSQEGMDRLFLKADDEDQSRWCFEHDIFDDTSSWMYKACKEKVAEPVKQWDDLDIFDDHLFR